MAFKILTIGWEPSLIESLLTPVSQYTGISFVHLLTGDFDRCRIVQNKFPDSEFLALIPDPSSAIMPPDFEFLHSLEAPGIPTIWSMLQSDAVLRYRQEEEALSYATSIGKCLLRNITEQKPDLILASFDSLHSGLSLAVGKKLNIPWVAMTFPVIPDTLVGFSNSLSPANLVPLGRVVDDTLRHQAEMLMTSVRTRQQQVMAFRAPVTIHDWLRQYLRHMRNFVLAKLNKRYLGSSRFTHFTVSERCRDILRRSMNRLFMPTRSMLDTAPEGKYAYFPLHMSHESVLDTWAPFFQDQFALCKQIIKSLPLDMSLVVKPHFSDPDHYSRGDFNRLMRIAGIRLAHPNSSGAAYIENANLVIGIQGTSNIEAALLGKPVFIFGNSPYLHFPTAVQAGRPDEWNAQIRSLLKRNAPSDDEVVDAYVHYIARYFPGRINDWSKPIFDEDLRKYGRSFLAIRDYLAKPETRKTWYDYAPFGNRPLY